MGATPRPGEGPVTEGLALRLNVPAFRLDVLENGAPTTSYRVAVGTPDHPTPLGEFVIQRVIWNPWWVPPPFPWAEHERLTPPGPDNPVGRVKIMIGTYLFIHGTPAEGSLGSAGSHGCVRMANADAIELARLLQRTGSPGVPAEEIDSLVANPKATREYPLEAVIPLSIEYRLAELRGDRLELHPDVYRMGRLTEPGIRSLLETSGRGPVALDPVFVEALLTRAAEEHVSVQMRDLLRPPGEPGVLPVEPLAPDL